MCFLTLLVVGAKNPTIEIGVALSMVNKHKESGKEEEKRDSGSSQGSNSTPTKNNRFTRMKKKLKLPGTNSIHFPHSKAFLTDAYKLCFVSGVLGSIAPLGYYMISLNGGEASTGMNVYNETHL